jgi:hypothetical protein
MRIKIPIGQFSGQPDDKALEQDRKELRRRLLNGESVSVGQGGTLMVPKKDQSSELRPSIVVPPGKLAASFYWYENDPQLYNLEVEAMTRPASPFKHFQLQREKDGRLSWVGTVNPGMSSGKHQSYVLQAVYDNNHPHNDSYGGSVKIYMVDPDLEEMRKIKPIPHLLPDSAGSLYICTSRKEDVKIGRVITSAASHLGWAVRWLSILELYLDDKVTYDEFSQHI